jgi:hypothetical protein
MARISNIILAQRLIADYFEAISKSVFTRDELFLLINEKGQDWKLPQGTAPGRIVTKWLKSGFIRLQAFNFSDDSTEHLYIYGNPSIYEIAVTLRPRSYISHYPAVFLHDLTTQVPKSIYTTKELTAKFQLNQVLTQSSIDKAFKSPQRRSGLQTEYEDYTIILLNGKYSNRSGVLLSTRYKNSFSYTGIERTLLDITVRPNYAGGAFAVLEAYRRAISNEGISENKFLTNLKTANFIYPYHQAIGFYLSRTGYSGKLLDTLDKMSKMFDFYLDYNMPSKVYDEQWRIWYPKGM